MESSKKIALGQIVSLDEKITNVANRSFDGTGIDSSYNLNDLRYRGSYNWYASIPSNSPTDKPAHLRVYRATSNIVVQKIYTYEVSTLSVVTFKRVYSEGSGWGGWQKSLNETSLINTARLYTAQQGTSLTPTNPTDYVNKEYVDSLTGTKPPVDETYADVAALLADQNNQEKDYFYEVTDASGLTAVSSGAAVLLYNTSTPTGTESDYIIIWSENPIGIVEQPLTDSATVNWNVSENQVARLLATSAVGNSRVLTISNSNPGVNYQLTYIQDATGGRDLDLSGFDKVYGSIDLTANAESIITVCVTNAGTSFVVITSDVSNNIYGRELKMISDATYQILNSDKDKFLYFLDANPSVSSANIFNEEDLIVGAFGGSGVLTFTQDFGKSPADAVLEVPEGFTHKLKSNGHFKLKWDGIITGDFIREFEIFESPNGTLYKVGVDDTGARTSSAL